MYEPEIGNDLKGSIAIEVGETNPNAPDTFAPKKVIRTTSPWSIEVTLRVEGDLAPALPAPIAGDVWEIKAYVESMTGRGPEEEVGKCTIDLAATNPKRTTGFTAAGEHFVEWKDTIKVDAGKVEMMPSGERYEVCRLTVAAITLNAGGTPLAVPHFATTEDLVSFYAA